MESASTTIEEMRDACVYIVDDEQAVRDGIADLVEGMNLSARSFGSAEEFLSEYDPEKFGCLLLDVRMPGMNGLELQSYLNDNGLVIPVVIITGHGDVSMAVKTVQAGAVDFIEKPFREQRLWESISKALEKARRERNKAAQKRETAQKLAKLTEREKEVLSFITRGFSDKETAHELNITQRAVAFHRNHILKKMQTASTVELASILAKMELSLKSDN